MCSAHRGFDFMSHKYEYYTCKEVSVPCLFPSGYATWDIHEFLTRLLVTIGSIEYLKKYLIVCNALKSAITV
jgi:hypothetical protein